MPNLYGFPISCHHSETPDSAYPRLVEGRESRRSVQAAVGDEINSLVSGGGREIENENSPKEDTVPNRLWHRGQPSTKYRKRVWFMSTCFFLLNCWELWDSPGDYDGRQPSLYRGEG
ncbi:hypothetical protein Acr_00g0013360 [Actinidia rufa]|uniref:Uncharacterized protein n=1 Tax=Actinidia rufa TaxID=165716 RepID=A0A7J0D6Y1_9ERIC|nr:hypothetical protein Acr_00g0002700 [Actinidia rufa]GFS30680.1 hypothetical protein Acr_00g0013360 [Actinidia rufa]